MKSFKIAMLMIGSIVGSVALASGSISLPSGGDQQAYNLGKKVVHQKITCETCPMADMELNEMSAKKIAKKVASSEGDLGLSAAEGKAAVAYLMKRFDL